MMLLPENGNKAADLLRCLLLLLFVGLLVLYVSHLHLSLLIQTSLALVLRLTDQGEEETQLHITEALL